MDTLLLESLSVRIKRSIPSVPKRASRAYASVCQPSRPAHIPPPEIRRLLYTKHAIESPHKPLRKIVKTRGYFPTDEAAANLLSLALSTIQPKWKRRSHAWKAAMP
jgi:transposase-like protein